MGHGYAWANRPHEGELATPRARVGLMDSVAQRVIKMTPRERRRRGATPRAAPCQPRL
jgi:hypothetical protein